MQELQSIINVRPDFYINLSSVLVAFVDNEGNMSVIDLRDYERTSNPNGSTELERIVSSHNFIASNYGDLPLGDNIDALMAYQETLDLLEDADVEAPSLVAFMGYSKALPIRDISDLNQRLKYFREFYLGTYASAAQHAQIAFMNELSEYDLYEGLSESITQRMDWEGVARDYVTYQGFRYLETSNGRVAAFATC